MDFRQFTEGGEFVDQMTVADLPSDTVLRMIRQSDLHICATSSVADRSWEFRTIGGNSRYRWQTWPGQVGYHDVERYAVISRCAAEVMICRHCPSQSPAELRLPEGL